MEELYWIIRKQKSIRVKRLGKLVSIIASEIDLKNRRINSQKDTIEKLNKQCNHQRNKIEKLKNRLSKGGTGMTFGEALEEMRDGFKVTRKGWNGKGMFIYLVQGHEVAVPNLRGDARKHVGMNRADYDTVKINSHVDMQAADGSIVVGWLASQTDMLAEDWEVVK